MLLRVNEQRNILHEIRKRKANWIGHILRRNCLPKQVTEGKIKGEMEVTRRRGRRRKKLLDDLKDRREYSHLKEEALDRKCVEASFWRTLWTCRQIKYWMNEWLNYSYVIVSKASRSLALTKPNCVPMAVCSSAENTYSCCSNIGGSSFKSISCTFTSASPVRVASVISVALIWKKVQMLFTIQSILLYL